MARIYAPKQRVSNSRWDSTVSSDEEGWTHPTGYCAGLREVEGEDPDRTAKKLELKDKFHSDGHATAEEAMECQLQYDLDFEVCTRGAMGVQHKCAADGCEEWTNLQTRVGEFHQFWLCNEHTKRDELEKLMRKEG